MLELIWVEDAAEARSEAEPARRLHLWERWAGRDGAACPFGVCLRPTRRAIRRRAVSCVGISPGVLAGRHAGREQLHCRRRAAGVLHPDASTHGHCARRSASAVRTRVADSRAHVRAHLRARCGDTFRLRCWQRCAPAHSRSSVPRVRCSSSASTASDTASAPICARTCRWSCSGKLARMPEEDSPAARRPADVSSSHRSRRRCVLPSRQRGARAGLRAVRLARAHLQRRASDRRAGAGLVQSERRMIARHWRGLVKRECADAYVEHLQSETLPQLVQLPGFHDASVLRRDVPQGVEFLVVTVWKSLDCDPQLRGQRRRERCRAARKRATMMIEYDRRARHYEVVRLRRAAELLLVRSATGESARSRATGATLPFAHRARAP